MGNDFEWFCDEVEQLASRLQLPLFDDDGSSNNARGRWALNNEENFTIATAEISNRSVEDEIEQNDEKSEKMAFEVQLTPQSQKKKSAKSPVLRTKTKPPAPRPHTVHIESGGGDARSVSMRTDRTVTLNGKKTTRARTYSDPVETEQDENKPPAEPPLAFEIGENAANDALAKNKDRWLRRQLEREEELRRRKLEYEDLKRNQEKEKTITEEYTSELKKIDQVRRQKILENHRQKLKVQSSPVRTKKIKPTPQVAPPTIPIDPFSPSRMSRSQSTMSNRTATRKVADNNEHEWDTMSCVSTMTTTPLFRQPSTKSNEKLMLMALKYQCLPGQVNASERKAAEEAVNSSPAKHFMALYKQNKFKGLYEVHQLEEIMNIRKIHGTGPKEVTEPMIADLLKYNSGSKSFQSVGSKTLSPSIDGFCIHAIHWQTKRTKQAASSGASSSTNGQRV